MSTALARIGSTALSIQDVMSVGGMLARSRYFQDASQEAQAVAKILAGQELGIPPVAAMTGIHVISGRITLSANLIASAIKRSYKYNYRVREMTESICKIEFLETFTQPGQLPQWESIGVSEFTIRDAQKAGTKNLDKFPRNMLFARAMSNGARWYCPDVFNGPIYTPEELGANVNEEGEVIDIQPVASFEPQPEPAAHSAPAPAIGEIDRDDLIKKIKAIGPAARALGVEFPVALPRDMTTTELRALYAACEDACAIDKLEDARVDP